MVKSIVSGSIALVVAVTIAFWVNPPSAQQLFPQPNPRFPLTRRSHSVFITGDIEYASIYLDGYPLFQIASQDLNPSESEPAGSLSPIERRVQRITGRLNNIINSGFDPQTLEVSTATLNNLTVIVASDRKNLSQQVLLTVTEIDALLDPSASIAELAQQRSQVIQEALIQAWYDRQPEARRRQALTLAIVVFGMAIVSYLLLSGQKWLKRHFKTLKKKAKNQEAPPVTLEGLPSSDGAAPSSSESLAVSSAFHQTAIFQKQLTLNIMFQSLAQIGLFLLWFGGVAAILYIFPETRLGGRGIILIPLRIFFIWLVLTLLSNLANLYVNYKLREWIEHGSVVSDNPQRLILRAPTILEVLKGIIGFAAWCIGIIWFLAWGGFVPSSLLTGAGILGAALTLAFQNLLQDWINGILIIFEDQYAVGDMIEFAGVLGIVENMSLRATQIRSPDGRLSTISHSQMTTAHNLTKDWSRVDFAIEVAYNTDPNEAIALMRQIAQEMAGDPQWQDDIIDPVNVIGVNRVAHSGLEIMMRIQVKRLRQWDVGREFRRRLKLAFDEKGIQIGVPQQSFLFPEDRDRN
jgi:small conductance mechanosensitive channel